MQNWSGKWRSIVTNLAAGLALLLMDRGMFAQTTGAEGQVERLLREADQALAARRFDEARQAYHDAARQAPAAYPAGNSERVRVLNQAALGLRRLGELSAAEELLSRAVEEMDGVRFPDPKQHERWLADLHNNLGLVLYQLGRSGSAEVYLKQALAARRALLGKDSQKVGETANNLGLALANLGLYEAAASQLEDARRIRSAADAEPGKLAETLNNLALVRVNQNRSAREIDSLLRQALELYEKQNDRLASAGVLDSLGYAAAARNEFAAAADWNSRALAIRQKDLPSNHSKLGASHHNLGVALTNLGRLEEAQNHLELALAIREKSHGRNSSALLMTLHGLTMIHVRRQNWPQAAASMDRARRIVRYHVGSALPVLDEAEQVAFLEGMSDRYTLFEALTLAYLRRDSSDTALLEQSAEWVVNGKAVANECMGELSLLARDSSDSSTRKAVSDLRTTRSTLANVRLAAAADNANTQLARQVLGLERREAQLRKEVGALLTRGERFTPWVNLADVRNSLPADAMLIELVRLPMFDFSSRPGQPLWQPDHYVAWVIPPAGQGQVKLIDLGRAAEIDEAIAAVRARLNAFRVPDAQRELIRKEREHAAELNKLLAGISERLLNPLLPRLGDCKRLIFVPDGQLWLVPWAALPLPSGKYLVESQTLKFLVSSRDLIRPPAPAGFGAAVILADPDYGNPAKAAASVRAFFGQAVESLPGFAQEANAVKPLLRQITGAEPRLLLRKEASEPAFKSLRQPGVVVLCTHGFFMDPAPAKGNQARSRGHALLRCGLVLANANTPERQGEDGILTGMEILDVDLRRTRLVMLSACETALGDVQTGEGVVGLRQAFHLAGAEKVIATLWTIPDRETIELSEGVFKHLAAGLPVEDALRRSQLDFIGNRREDRGAAHPFFWAAFMLTGR